MEISAWRQRIALGKGLAWIFWSINLLFISWVGFGGLVSSSGGASIGEWWIVTARLWGLLATFCVLVQIVVIGRVGWLEPVFGMDKLAIFHRRNGLVAFSLIILHVLCMVIGYALWQHKNIIVTVFDLLHSPLLVLAFIAELLFVAAVVASIYAVRKHLKFEVWYAIHLVNYAAVAAVIWHQLILGADIAGNEPFRWYWIGLYIFAVVNILAWRWLRPIVRSRRFRFKVAKVEVATPSATSVYIEGKGLETFGAHGGQFIMVRFLTPKLWFEEHPFSMSMLPTNGMLRITARQLGDFTNQLKDIPVGTKVIVSGPHGSFTHVRSVTNKTLYIAGGIGITPIRSLLQERATWSKPGNAVLLYGNRTEQETALWPEIRALAAKVGMPVFNILSDQPGYKGEKGYIDQEKIERLVPDARTRDVFVCGPPAMVNAVLPVLEKAKIPKKQIHFERFSLHKQ